MRKFVGALDANGNPIPSPDGTHCNSAPKGWREVSAEVYAQSLAFRYEPKLVEYRQMHRTAEGVDFDTVLMGNLEWFFDGTGTCICSVQERKPEDYGYFARLRFFLFGCAHEYHPMTPEEQEKHGVRNQMFLTNHFCPKCGHIECHDSSD